MSTIQIIFSAMAVGVVISLLLAIFLPDDKCVFDEDDDFLGH
jgi:ABC-type phosphate/phosphonate transport system permease subunit